MAGVVPTLTEASDNNHVIPFLYVGTIITSTLKLFFEETH